MKKRYTIAMAKKKKAKKKAKKGKKKR